MVRLNAAIIATAVFAALASSASALDNQGVIQTFDCYCSNASGYCMSNYDPNTPTHFSCEPQSRPGQKACNASCILKETTGDGSAGGIARKKLPAAIGKGGDLPTLTPTP